MKKIHKIACGVISLSMLAFWADNSIAQNCCALEAMHAEGPVYECQKKTSPVKLSKNDVANNHGEMLAEGPLNPTRLSSQQNGDRLASKTYSSKDLANMWTEGISYSSSKASIVLASAKGKIIKTQPAAGQ